MRGVHLQVLLLALVQPGLGQSASKPAAVPLNTPVEIELLDTISSETIRDGQQIPFRIVTPVQVDGVTVLEAGTAVIGEVRAVKTSGAWKRPGSFDLILEPIEFGDGSQVKLDFLRPKRLSTKKEKTTTALVAGPVLFYYFPVIPFRSSLPTRNAANPTRFDQVSGTWSTSSLVSRLRLLRRPLLKSLPSRSGEVVFSRTANTPTFQPIWIKRPMGTKPLRSSSLILFSRVAASSAFNTR